MKIVPALAVLFSIFLCQHPCLASPANENRVALVIGNSRYEAVARLTNPVSDSKLIASSLLQAGFSSVELVSDLSREKLIDALKKFAIEVEKSDWAVIYYAGHGIELGGMNYLIPVDARLKTDRDVQFEAVPLTQVLASVESARKLRLLILDACRDNPFSVSMTRTLSATRSIGRGLATVEPEGGVLVAYAAKHGQVAEDGFDNNSPFASSLAKHMSTPGLEINRLFRRVTGDVLIATNRRQEPFTYGSLPDEDFYFRIPVGRPSVDKQSLKEEFVLTDSVLSGPNMTPTIESFPDVKPSIGTSVRKRKAPTVAISPPMSKSNTTFRKNSIASIDLSPPPVVKPPSPSSMQISPSTTYKGSMKLKPPSPAKKRVSQSPIISLDRPNTHSKRSVNSGSGGDGCFTFNGRREC